MMTKSLRNTLLINFGAFLLVLMLELLSGWLFIDKHKSVFSFYNWAFSYTIVIMAVIWVNHFALIPYFFDKKKYVIYGVLLVGTILLGSYLKGYPNRGLVGVYKMFFYLIYSTGTGMAAYFLRRSILMQRQEEEKEILQKEIELNYLKEQVNPHFLFNSLNSIYSLSRQQSSETPEVVMQLSELMRYQLESSKKNTVLLKEELEFVENYLLLEEKRLSKRCNVEFLIDGDVLELTIAPMLLIPFVENAIKHGAQATNEPSKIDISVSVKSTQLNFCDENSKPETIANSKREGFGLENVKRRLNLLYPLTHQLKIIDLEDTYQVNLSIDLSESIINQ